MVTSGCSLLPSDCVANPCLFPTVDELPGTSTDVNERVFDTVDPELFHNDSFNSDYRLGKMDVNSFLERIHVTREDHQGITKLQLLEAIIRGCMEHVPFQNVTMLTRVHDNVPHHRPPTLDQIINDMTSGIGGLCTTLNPFLLLLLKSLDFEDVQFVCATMCDPGRPRLKDAHIALLVRVDSSVYWVDVANGPHPTLEPKPMLTSQLV